MLFNCLQCGKMISSRAKLCPYCATSHENITGHMNEKQEKSSLNLRETYKGSIFSLILKEKKF